MPVDSRDAEARRGNVSQQGFLAERELAISDPSAMGSKAGIRRASRPALP